MKRRILIVDDDKHIRSLLREHLGTTYEVDLAESGAQAFAAVVKHRPDVILLDITMPGISGLDVMKAIREMGVTTPILVITGIEFWLFFGINLVQGHPWLMLLVLLLTIPSIYGFGIAFGSLVLRFKEANALVFIVRGLFLVFCGTTYPLAVLPGWMQAISAWLPLTYTIQAIRVLGAPDATFADVQTEVGLLALFAVALPILGVFAFQTQLGVVLRGGVLRFRLPAVALPSLVRG